MFGINLLTSTTTTETLFQASAQAGAFSSGGNTVAAFGLRATEVTETDTRSTLARLSGSTLAAIFQAAQVLDQPGVLPGAAQPSEVARVLDGLGQTLAGGQGAYVISLRTPAGGAIFSVTPAGLADLLAGAGTTPFAGAVGDALSRAVRQPWRVLDGEGPGLGTADPARLFATRATATSASEPDGVQVSLIHIPAADAVTTDTRSFSLTALQAGGYDTTA